ncbi:MAG: DNA polymerase III subunit alpha [Gammaproteobacteria bacterium]|nr:DNA polymerase III subunit alpha [Gammaproteobacteria bacterium]
MEPKFIHLDVHTEYSLIDSVVRIDELMESCNAAQMPGIALTDYMNLFALVKFYKAALAKSIKPVIGMDILLANPQDAKHAFRAILLCKNKEGYHSVTKLVSRAYVEGQQSGTPLIQRQWLAECNAGLILLSGAQNGDVGQLLLSGKVDAAEKIIQRYQELFPDSYYFEVQRVGHPNEAAYIDAILPLAEKYQIPLVATNAVRFLTAEDFTAHEARVAIHDGYALSDPRRPMKYTNQQYLRTPEEMAVLFKDLPEAIENSVEIYKRCNFELSLGKSYLPNFTVPAGLTLDQYFLNSSEAGLLVRLQQKDAALTALPTEYQDRLMLEINVISKMGFSGYYLIVADLIRWAKNNAIPVGPGRGSGPGSLAAYALNITDLDPITHVLLFERFLNSERVSMPDFDIDFCMEGRDRVIEYVANKYGREAVSQIITYGTMAAKAVVRDVGRVLGQPYGFVDRIAKLIPFEIGMTLETALDQEPQLQELYDKETEVQELIDLAMRLEGITRNVGKHAGGVVIAPSKLTDFTPIYTECEGGAYVSQFDKDDVEAVGLVKFDFLGLRTLTIINWTIQCINKHRKEQGLAPIDIQHIPLDDAPTFNLLKACNTTAIFQLESRGMKDLIKRLQPDLFADIVALVALFRPGPLQSGMVDEFINRKHGRADVDYMHPALTDVLKDTYGVILYQEQVMQIAQVLAGYTLGSADMLRVAMGKKKPEEMARQRTIFTEGAVQQGVDRKLATHIFDLMEKFAGYGFNKSHSAAYALVSYQTAWLKQHYPAEFMAAVLSSDMDNTDKVVIFYEDCKMQGLTILPPSINHSEYKFTVDQESKIRYGLGAVKGAGEAAISLIIENRRQQGAFKDLFELCQRIDLRKANRRVLEALIKAGAFDEFGQERSVLSASLESAIKAAEQTMRTQDLGQHDLFGGFSSHDTAPAYHNVAPWTETQRLVAEKESLGLYLSGHPLTIYGPELNQIVKSKINDLDLSREKSIRLAGIVLSVRTVNTRRGERMAILTLEDQTARIELPIFPELYQKNRGLLIADTLLVVDGKIEIDRFTSEYRLTPNTLYSLEQARGLMGKAIVLYPQAEQMSGENMDRLKAILGLHRAGASCSVLIDYQATTAAARLNLGPTWRVKPSDKLLDDLRQLLGDEAVKVEYS